MLYISYGITRSGSTLLYKLTQGLAESLGFVQKQCQVATDSGHPGCNYSVQNSQQNLEFFESQGSGITVVKTHEPPTEYVASQLSSGNTLANMSIRDPRDVALSLLEKGLQLRQRGFEEKAPFASLMTFDDVVVQLKSQLEVAMIWAGLPNIRIFRYEDTAINKYFPLHIMYYELLKKINPANPNINFQKIIQGIDNRHTQFNIGKSGRYANHFSPEQQLEILGLSEEYMSTYYPDAEIITSESIPTKI